MSASTSRARGAIGAIAGLVGFSILSGVLATAMVTPALAVTSTAAKGSLSVFDDLPSYIAIGNLPGQNQIYAEKGGQPVKIASIYDQNREQVGWNDVSPLLKNAAVDGEDRRFYDHGGVDLPSVVRAAVKNVVQSSAGTSGGSTLDMQLVKNILVQEALQITDPNQQKAQYQAAISDSLDRKLKEMKLAIGLDKKYTKKQILLAYLNIVGMGGTTYGVEAAAEHYMSTTAKNVTVAQAASLIATVQQPNDQSLASPANYPANKTRRDEILADMLQAKHITQKQYETALNTPIADEVKIQPSTNGCRAAADAPTACDYVSKIITSTLDPSTPNAAPAVNALGSTPAERKANWAKGGYKIYTSIDLDLQDVAQANLNTWAPPTESRLDLGAAADTVEAGTGRILVMAQNKVFDDAGIAEGTAPDPSKTALNLGTDHPYGGSNGFATGSTFKIFDLANWLQTGHGLNDLVDPNPPKAYHMSQFPASCIPGGLTGPDFTVNNDGNAHYPGFMTAKEALVLSVNNAFMHMAEQQDLCDIRSTADSMGAHLASFATANGGDLRLTPTTVIGTNEQAPLTMAAAAATVGSGGVYCKPIIIDSIVDSSGKKLPGQQQTCDQGITADVAAGVANAMAGSMTGGTSALANPHDSVAIGGKTGTSPNADQDWVLATTTKLATAVWTGNIDGKTLNLQRYTNPITHRDYYDYSRFAISKAITAQADTDPNLRGAATFPDVPSSEEQGASTTVPDVSGQVEAQGESVLTGLGFQTAEGGTEASALPAGTITRTDPAAGTPAPKGATVTVYTSDGSLAVTMPNVVGQTKHDALDRLQTAGVAASDVTVRWIPGGGPSATVCTVSASDPDASSTLSPGEDVTLSVYGTPTGTDPGTCT